MVIPELNFKNSKTTKHFDKNLRHCLKNMLGASKWLKCPVCSTIYGRMLGDQPEGKMTHYVDHKMKC